jgi:hypothetical protein
MSNDFGGILFIVSKTKEELEQIKNDSFFNPEEFTLLPDIGDRINNKFARRDMYMITYDLYFMRDVPVERLKEFSKNFPEVEFKIEFSNMNYGIQCSMDLKNGKGECHQIDWFPQYYPLTKNKFIEINWKVLTNKILMAKDKFKYLFFKEEDDKNDDVSWG